MIPTAPVPPKSSKGDFVNSKHHAHAPAAEHAHVCPLPLLSFPAQVPRHRAMKANSRTSNENTHAKQQASENEQNLNF